jgi:sarcosine oxidase subunit gamma
MADASGDDVRLRGVPGVAQTGLRVAPAGEAAERVAAALGVALPLEPCTVAAVGERRVLWLGPDEWVVIGAPGSEAATLQALREAVGDTGSAVDLSANRVVVEVAGPAARDVLSTCCPLDLHPRAFGPDRVAGTLLGTAQAFVEQTTDEPCFRIHVRPSFLAYAVDWLVAGVEGVRAGAQATG